MAKRIKKAEDMEVQAEVYKPTIETKEFTLKKAHEGKKPGDTIRLGEKGEQFYKSKNVI